MPLLSDEKLIQPGNDLIKQLDTVFGLHPGFRPAHAKGTPATVRLSDSTGLPTTPDNGPNANPRGLGIRFHLADRVHTERP